MRSFVIVACLVSSAHADVTAGALRLGRSTCAVTERPDRLAPLPPRDGALDAPAAQAILAAADEQLADFIAHRRLDAGTFWFPGDGLLPDEVHELDRRGSAESRRLQHWVLDFVARFRRLDAAYAKLASLGATAQVASLARRGVLYEILESEVRRMPRWITCGEPGVPRDLYVNLLQSDGMEVRAVELYGACARIAAAHGLDDWWARCDSGLTRLRPLENPPLNEIVLEPRADSPRPRALDLQR